MARRGGPGGGQYRGDEARHRYPWVVRLLAECLRDAGLPDGVFNFVTGPGSTLGQALITCADVDGATFTGSFEVGMGIFRDFSNCSYVRPIILELGGKNPVIVSRHADLESHRGHPALGLWAAGAEMLGGFACICGRAGV